MGGPRRLRYGGGGISIFMLDDINLPPGLQRPWRLKVGVLRGEVRMHLFWNFDEMHAVMIVENRFRITNLALRVSR